MVDLMSRALVYLVGASAPTSAPNTTAPKKSNRSLTWVVSRWVEWTLTPSIKAKLISDDGNRIPDARFAGWIKSTDGPYTWQAFRRVGSEIYQRALVTPRGFLSDERYREEPPQGPYEFED